jgi:hypothetical protein
MLMAATILAAFSDIAVLAKKEKTITPPSGAKISPSETVDEAPAEEVKESTTKTKVTKVDEYTRHLKFDADNSFRVVQFSDIWADGDDQNFLNTQKFIQNVIKKEKPDLIVVTGDVVDPSLQTSFEGHWQSAMENIVASKVPYISTGGSELESVARADTLSIDRSFGGKLSWSGFKWNLADTRVDGTEEQIGFYTARIPIMDATGD